jgi:hypothetical protein
MFIGISFVRHFSRRAQARFQGAENCAGLSV